MGIREDRRNVGIVTGNIGETAVGCSAGALMVGKVESAVVGRSAVSLSGIVMGIVFRIVGAVFGFSFVRDEGAGITMGGILGEVSDGESWGGTVRFSVGVGGRIGG
jgi:hypothetical protein